MGKKQVMLEYVLKIVSATINTIQIQVVSTTSSIVNRLLFLLQINITALICNYGSHSFQYGFHFFKSVGTIDFKPLKNH